MKLSPFTLSLSKGAQPRRSCFDKLSTNGLNEKKCPYNYGLISKCWDFLAK